MIAAQEELESEQEDEGLTSDDVACRRPPPPAACLLLLYWPCGCARCCMAAMDGVLGSRAVSQRLCPWHSLVSQSGGLHALNRHQHSNSEATCRVPLTRDCPCLLAFAADLTEEEEEEEGEDDDELILGQEVDSDLGEGDAGGGRWGQWCGWVGGWVGGWRP